MDKNLCDSPLTKEKLETIFHAYFHSSPKLECIQAEVISKGKGFLSDVVRVHLKWDSYAPDNGLPKTVIVKTPKVDFINDDVKFEENFIVTVHQGECDAYNMLQTDCPIPIPKVYATAPITKTSPGLLVMEDMEGKGGFIDCLATGVTLGQWRSIVTALADLHAWSLTTNVQWRSKVNNAEAMATNSESERYYAVCTNLLNQVRDKYPEYFNNLDVQLGSNVLSLDAQPKMYEVFAEAMPQVLTHGDTWINNILFNKNPDGSLGDIVVAFLDWQMAMEGHGVCDIVHFEIVSVNRDTRRKHATDMLRFYYDRLHSKAPGKVGTSFEKLEKAYQKAFIMSTFFRLTVIDNMVLSAGEEAHQKKEMLERLQGAYEDAIKFTTSSLDMDHSF